MGTDIFSEALLGGGSAGLPAHDLYGRFLGVWDLVVNDRQADGTIRVSRGEWIFERTLEGASIQDIFIVPSRAARARNDWGRALVRYGMSHRQPVPGTPRWTVDYFGPATGVHCRLVAQAEGGQIIQTGTDDKGVPYRWVFSDMQADRFRWRNETWKDGEWVETGWFDATRADASSSPG